MWALLLECDSFSKKDFKNDWSPITPKKLSFNTNVTCTNKKHLINYSREKTIKKLPAQM